MHGLGHSNKVLSSIIIIQYSMHQVVLPTKLARTVTGCLCGKVIANVYDVTTRTVIKQQLLFRLTTLLFRCRFADSKVINSETVKQPFADID